MIPKKIHYCWFGKNEKSKLTKRCIESWKRHCPEYEIIEWNENNFDISQHPYLVWCYENKKWAFFSDFARLLIVRQHGGIYFDTDVELMRNPDMLLQYAAFYGFENKENINTGLGFGAEADHKTVNAMIDIYKNLKKNVQTAYPLIACPALNTQALFTIGAEVEREKTKY